jgi:glycerol-3-phosphate acyltransferase PlsY
MFWVALFTAYLLGSLPFAVWISKWFYHQDIRTMGSGNAGSTNMYRNFGFIAGFTTQILDILKSYVATLLPFIFTLDPRFQSTSFLLLFGAISVIGHVYPIFAGFRGGKGVNSILGMMLAIAPVYTFLCLIVFILVLWIWEYVSLGSILATFSFIIFQVIGYVIYKTLDIVLLIAGSLLFLFIVYTHRENIQRIRKGTESKASFIQKLKRK